MTIDKRIFFIHIPKTGGTTVQNALHRHFADACPYMYDFDFIKEGAQSDLEKYRLFRGHIWYYVASALPKPLFTFTFLRHPVARSISAYEWVMRMPDHIGHRILKEENITLKQFAEHPVLRHYIENVQTRMLGVDFDFAGLLGKLRKGVISQEEALNLAEQARVTPANQAMLNRAKARLFGMNFFGLLELFELSYTKLLEALDLQIADAPMLNATPEEVKQARERFTEEDIRAVKNVVSVDLELYEAAEREFGQRNS